MDAGPDRRLARLAARHHGFVTLAQLRELGFGRGAISARVKLGRLIAVHSGVYAVGHVRIEPAAGAAAAVLAGGARAS